MPKGIYKRTKPNPRKGKLLSKEHRRRISEGRKAKGIGNTNGKGKNLGNKNAYGKTRGHLNGNWKGGIRTSAYKEKLAGRSKPDKCEICQKMGNTDFDHDHKTGKFRGWLCRRCNLVLGMVEDNPKLLKTLIEYLFVNTNPPKVILDYAFQSNNSNNKDSSDVQEDKSSTRGNIGEQDNINTALPDSIIPIGQNEETNQHSVGELSTSTQGSGEGLSEHTPNA